MNKKYKSVKLVEKKMSPLRTAGWVVTIGSFLVAAPIFALPGIAMIALGTEKPVPYRKRKKK